MPVTIKTGKVRYNDNGEYVEIDAVGGSGGTVVDPALSTLSENPVQNKVVTAALNALQSGKQNTLTFDSTPTAGSSNPVTSGGVAEELDDLKSSFDDLDDTVTGLSSETSDMETAILNLRAGFVPASIRQSILALLSAAIYTETGLDDEIANLEAWAADVFAIAINQQSVSITGISTVILTATTTPVGGAVLWTTSNPDVATVDGGVVRSVGNGTCLITASSGSQAANCVVTVTGIKTLVSISAVYTQTGTVYDTDDLSVLETDLVVTGHYDDSTTAVIAAGNYTLSGTLTAGTSTITVTVNNKTTTFTVAVTAFYANLAGYAFAYPDNILRIDVNSARGCVLARDGDGQPLNTGTGVSLSMYPIAIPAGATGVNITSTTLDVGMMEAKLVDAGYYRLGSKPWSTLSGEGSSRDLIFSYSDSTYIIIVAKEPSGADVAQIHMDALTWHWLY